MNDMYKLLVHDLNYTACDKISNKNYLYRLKQHIQEGPKEGPYQSCMKFMKVYELLETKFGSVVNVEATKVVSQAFPEAERDRSTYMIGIRPVFTTSAASMSNDVLTCPGPSLRSPVLHLHQKAFFLHS